MENKQQTNNYSNQIKLDWQEQVHFIATDEQGHQVHIDGNPTIGGQDLGVRPMELVLMGLAGCSAIDIVTILKKTKQHFDKFQIIVHANRSANIPSVFSEIYIEVQAQGEISQAKLVQACQLSIEKYCSVIAMINKTANITWHCVASKT